MSFKWKGMPWVEYQEALSMVENWIDVFYALDMMDDAAHTNMRRQSRELTEMCFEKEFEAYEHI